MMGPGSFTLRVTDSFSASHQLLGYPGKCSRLHGHNYRVEVAVQGRDLDALGMVVDLGTIKAALALVLDALDHRHLGDVEPFSVGTNATSENLAVYIAGEMHARGVSPSSITVWESERASVTYECPVW
jgi:6-pyruvoyltetrahydropterin/6-carboxytetrahydropterin synthase